MFNNNSAQNISQNSRGQGYQTRSTNQQNTNSQYQNAIQNNYQNTYQNNYQNSYQQNQQSLSQTQQNQYLSFRQEQEIIKFLQNIYHLANNQDIFKFRGLLLCSMQNCQEVIEKAKKLNANLEKSSKEQAQIIIKRVGQIKNRNVKILKSMLNLRQRFIHQMYMYKIRAPSQEIQLEGIMEKIRGVSAQIKSKLNRLNFSKQLKPNAPQRKHKMEPINAPLVELRQATEKLCKQTLKIREQLKLCLKFLNADPR